MDSDGETGVREFDVVVVGAGFAGLYALYRLRELGLSVRVVEAGDGVGGTWFWNRYPGARCDIESLDYSYSFSEELQREWVWSERYASQPEILRYLEHVADRFDLRRHISLGTRVTRAVLDETEGRWTAKTDGGAYLRCRYVVMATGCLSDARVPDLPGLDSFAGQSFHTARWPSDATTFDGRSVGVIGTGSSGVQVIPILADRAENLTVFQRTPAYSLPAHNRYLDPADQDRVKAHYPEFREAARKSVSGVAPLPSAVSHLRAMSVDADTRAREYQWRWDHGGNALTGAFIDLLANPEANRTAADFIRAKIADAVTDPARAATLSPDYAYGAKRPCIDTGYYATYNRQNVALVDLQAEPLVEIVPDGVRTSRGVHPLDDLVLATGFDAFTGSLSKIDIIGRDGVTLNDHWAAGPRTYLGVGLPGFPNLFLITGPGSPSVLSNMVVSIEQHVDWITDLIRHTDKHCHDFVEPSVEAENSWMAHTRTLARRTVYHGANSWYTGANVPGKPEVVLPYVGGVAAFRRHCDAVAEGGYRELTFSRCQADASSS